MLATPGEAGRHPAVRPRPARTSALSFPSGGAAEPRGLQLPHRPTHVRHQGQQPSLGAGLFSLARPHPLFHMTAIRTEIAHLNSATAEIATAIALGDRSIDDCSPLQLYR